MKWKSFYKKIEFTELQLLFFIKDWNEKPDRRDRPNYNEYNFIDIITVYKCYDDIEVLLTLNEVSLRQFLILKIKLNGIQYYK